MSLPSFPERDSVPTREEAVNQILSSIAMEELGLSHIINAEGEKLQYALGTIPGVDGPADPLTVDDLLALNRSVHKTLDSTMMNQFFLKDKLVHALSASVMQGPTGPRGPQGPATINIDPEVENLEPGEAPYVNNDQGTPEDVYLKFGIPRGLPGADGATPTVEVAATQTLEPGEDANVTSAPTDTGIELTFQIPRGDTGATPTVTVAATQTLEPGEDANVISTPTDTGIELAFQIPRGTTGTTQLSGIQVTLENEESEGTQIGNNTAVPFNQLVNSSGSDITFDDDTGIITIDTNGLNNVYMINWWVFVDGTTITSPVTFSLNVGTTSYLTVAPLLEMQLSGSTLAIVEADEPIEVSLTNVSGETVSFYNVRFQAQINIIGFRAAS